MPLMAPGGDDEPLAVGPPPEDVRPAVPEEMPEGQLIEGNGVGPERLPRSRPTLGDQPFAAPDGEDVAAPVAVEVAQSETVERVARIEEIPPVRPAVAGVPPGST